MVIMFFLKIYEIVVIFGIEVYNFDVLFIIYLCVLFLWFNFLGLGEGGIKDIERKNIKYDKKLILSLRNY